MTQDFHIKKINEHDKLKFRDNIMFFELRSRKEAHGIFTHIYIYIYI
jgi:hypothetical protein